MIAIYCRISRFKDDGKDRSIDDQKQLGVQKSKELNMPYEFYVDKGISGAGDSLEERPAITKLLEDVIAKKIKAVFVIDESRLSRNPRTKYLITDVFKAYNVITFSYIDGEIDYSNPDDEFISEIKGIIHKRQITEQKIKIKSVLKSNAKAGRAHGILPYGYTKDDNGFLVVEKVESKIIIKIFKLSLSGKGTNKIAEILNNNNIPTRYNKIQKGTITTVNKQTGKLTTTKKADINWAGNTIRNIISNPIYKGMRKFSNNIYSSPIIIEPKLWNKVNHNLKNNSNTSGKQTEHLYLLKGFLECGKCGRNMYGRTRVNKKDNYYMCSSKRYKKENCGNRSINIDGLNSFIWSQMLLEEKFKKHLIDSLNNSQIENNIKDLYRQLEVLEKQHIKLGKEKQKAIQFAIKGLIEENDIRNEIERITNKIKDIEVKKIKIENQIQYLNINLKTEKEIRNDFKQISTKTDFNTKKQLLKKYIKRIKIRWVVSNRKYYVEVIFHSSPKSLTYILNWQCNFLEMFNPINQIINDNTTN